MRIGATQATELLVTIGKIGGATLASGYTRPIDDQTYTFELTGPELGIWLRRRTTEHDRIGAVLGVPDLLIG